MLNKIDFLSPPITLFHLERRTHTSKIGACLVITLIIICLSFAIFLLYNLITHNKMTYIFHKKFEFEAGHYSFNSSSVFHFIQIFSTEGGGYFDIFDSRYIRAYTTYARSNLSYDNLYLSDHWLFDSCRKDIDDKDLEPSLFENVENFTNGVCIRHYYNSLEKKYYSFGTKGFKWPYLEHGISQRNNIYLTTIVQKCSNNSIINQILGKCHSQKEIDDYLSKYLAIYLYFTDTQVDPTNYEKPITKYLQVVSTGIGTSQTYVESYIHFSPLRIKTKIGSIFGNNYDINSFYFDFNRKGAANNAGEKYFTITKYYHLMQNNVQIYERRYNNIFDIFSDIGGISQFIFYLFYWINYIYNQFVIDFDTNYLFFSIQDNKSNNNRNNNIKITSSISNKIKINGNDNKIYHIQNNIVQLSGKGKKRYGNSKFYVDKSNKKESKNNNQGLGISIKPIEIYKEDNCSSNKGKNDKALKSKIRREKTLVLKKFNIDSSKDFLFKINKDTEIFDNLESKNNENNRLNNPTNNNINLKYNKTIIRSKKNNLDFGLNNKPKIIKEDENKKISNEPNKNFISNIFISKTSINKINYKKGKEVSDKRNCKKIKSFYIINYIRNIFSKKERENYQYLSLFRKHLLSEEHLLKSHIYMVLFGKKYDLDKDETTNIFECYNEL